MRRLRSWTTYGYLLLSGIFTLIMLAIALMSDSGPVEPLRITMKEDPPYLVSPTQTAHIVLFAKGGKEPYKWAVYDFGSRTELPGGVYDREPEAGFIKGTVTLEVMDRTGSVAQQRITLWQDASADMYEGYVGSGGESDPATENSTDEQQSSCNSLTGLTCTKTQEGLWLLTGLLLAVGLWCLSQQLRWRR
jgi:hypothetical protein